MPKLDERLIIKAAIADSYKGSYRIVGKGGTTLSAGDASLMVGFDKPENFNADVYEARVKELLSVNEEIAESESGEGDIASTIDTLISSSLLTPRQRKEYAIARLAYAAAQAESTNSIKWLKQFSMLFTEVVGADKKAEIEKMLEGKRGSNAFRANKGRK